MRAFLLSAVSLLIAAAMFVWLGVNGALGFSGELAAWCRSFISACAGMLPFIKVAAFWASLTVVGAGIVNAFVRAAYRVLRSGAALKALPLYDRNLGFVLIKDNSLRAAFTHGIIRPRVYISTGLVASLSRKELGFVLLHELSHVRRRDPLRFFMMSFLRDMFFYLPLSVVAEEELRAEGEARADAFAVRKTGDVVAFSETLIKVARLNAFVPSSVEASISGGPSLEERVKRLIGAEYKQRKTGLGRLCASVFVAAVIIIGLGTPAVAGFGANSCTVHHCEKHGHAIDSDCISHCEAKHDKGHESGHAH